MDKRKTIPAKVKEAAQWYTERFGDRLSYLGKKDGKEYYRFSLPDNRMLGFPVVFQLNNGEVLEIGGVYAMDIIKLFFE